MDISGSKLVVAMAERNVHVYDVRKLDEPEQRRESALKYMTRDVACMADGKGKAWPTHLVVVLSFLRSQLTD